MNAASDCRCSRKKSGHDTVAGVLYLPTALCSEGFTHDPVVHAEDFHRLFVTEALGHIRGADDVGEKHTANPLIALSTLRSGQYCRAAGVGLRLAKKSFGEFGSHLDDSVSHCAVRLTVYGSGGVGVGRSAQAKNLSGGFVQ